MDSVSRETSDSGGTPSDFEKLLKLFDADPEKAAEQYEVMRLKLRSFFRWRGAADPDHFVDETMDRVLRRISDGAIIHSPSSYFYSVSRHLLREQAEKNARLQNALQTDPYFKLEHNPLVEQAQEDEAAEAAQRLACLKSCLGKLSAPERNLILQYYRFGTEGKIHRRKELAATLGIPLNALRIRVFRIRARLSECTTNCLHNLKFEPPRRAK